MILKFTQKIFHYFRSIALLTKTNSTNMDRKWNDNFTNYTEMIVNHPNYKGLFFQRGRDGKVKWVVAGKSENGLLRRAWWDKQCIAHKIPIEPGCYAKIAVKIHPTKLHVCQICGRSLFVKYVYPNKRSQNQLNQLLNIDIAPYTLSIFDIVEKYGHTEQLSNGIKKVFKINLNIPNEELAEYIYQNCATRLSPGVMSNSPDRFDGFHSDGNCCRGESDKGRHKDNLQRYTQDRRVYENWSDGDWKMADRLMSEFSKHGVSADHIGPISLGFCHRPKFQPMSKSENSAKNNRMSYSDVKILIEDEINGDIVVSWHSKYLWDKLKNNVTSDKDAVKLSSLMRTNLHQILTIFSIISEKGCDEFLKKYLNPQYSYADYKFVGFDPNTGSYKKVIPEKLTGKNQQNNAERYIRIAFESLSAYKEKENRRQYLWENMTIDSKIDSVVNAINANDYNKADFLLKDVISELADIVSKKW